MSNYGIPYMGSKDGIVRSIAAMLPKADHFYDLFGGGFSVTHFMIEQKANKYKYFHYNEIEKSTVELVEKAIGGYYNYKIFKPEWVSREHFFANLNDAYVSICWSFGNNQKSYMFKKDIEPYKKSMHMAVVFDEFDSTVKRALGINAWPYDIDSIYKKRIYIRRKVKYLLGGEPRRLQQLEQLERLQRLQQLEQLEQLERLELTSSSYDQIEIQPNAIVYCDPPYSDTAKYTNKFDTKKFLNWAATRDFPVYISEYHIADSRFKLIYEVDKRSKLSQDKFVGDKAEKLYWNGVSF